MRRGDALDPAIDLEVAGGDEGAHALNEELHARAGHGVDTRVAHRRECAVESESAAVGEVAHVERSVRVHVDAGSPALHRPHEVEVARGVFVVGPQRPLDADLGRAESGGIRGDLGGVVEVELSRARPTRATEPGRGEVAVLHEGDGLADGCSGVRRRRRR